MQGQQRRAILELKSLKVVRMELTRLWKGCCTFVNVPVDAEIMAVVMAAVMAADKQALRNDMIYRQCPKIVYLLISSILGLKARMKDSLLRPNFSHGPRLRYLVPGLTTDDPSHSVQSATSSLRRILRMTAFD